MNARRPANSGQSGQMIVLFALSLVGILAMSGLLVDGGMAWVHRREAQAAADTSALAAAQAASNGTSITDAAQAIAAANGFSTSYTACNGSTATNGVVVNRPPLSGPHVSDTDYIEVYTNKPMRTAFAGTVGQSCWLVTARAVASVKTQVAECSFCALSNDSILHHLVLDNGADLRVDGDIVLNGTNLYTGTTAVNQCGGNAVCTAANCAPTLTWDLVMVCGDVVDLKQSGGSVATTVSAQTISLAGGWEAHGGNIMKADHLPTGCAYHPEPPAYAVHYPGVVANVCLGTAQIADPLNDSTKPLNVIPAPDPTTLAVPVAGQNGCPVGSTVPTGTFSTPNKLSIAGVTAAYTICPGLYYGGFSVFGDNRNPKVTMMPGVYFMVGGGFNITGTAAVDGSAGVMIYNSGGIEAFSSSTSPGVDMVPTCPNALLLISTCVSPTITGGGNGLSSSVTSPLPGATVKYTMSLLKTGTNPKPTGGSSSIIFYDGTTPIACSPSTIGGDANHLTATCTTSYSLYGSRAITAVYKGDSVYMPIGDTLTQHIVAPSNSAIDNIIINTNTIASSCHVVLWVCGSVTLHAPTSGRYSGVLLFQDRLSGLDLQIWPATSSAPACTGNWMTDGVPPSTAGCAGPVRRPRRPERDDLCATRHDRIVRHGRQRRHPRERPRQRPDHLDDDHDHLPGQRPVRVRRELVRQRKDPPRRIGQPRRRRRRLEGREPVRVSSRTQPLRPPAQRGQMLVVFALSMVAILAMAGLLIDGGMAWQNRREAQSAADTAALAAAQSASRGGAYVDTAKVDLRVERLPGEFHGLRRSGAHGRRRRQSTSGDGIACGRRRIRRSHRHPSHAHVVRSGRRAGLLDGLGPGGRVGPDAGCDVQLLHAQRLAQLRDPDAGQRRRPSGRRRHHGQPGQLDQRHGRGQSMRRDPVHGCNLRLVADVVAGHPDVRRFTVAQPDGRRGADPPVGQDHFHQRRMADPERRRHDGRRARRRVSVSPGTGRVFQLFADARRERLHRRSEDRRPAERPEQAAEHHPRSGYGRSERAGCRRRRLQRAGGHGPQGADGDADEPGQACDQRPLGELHDLSGPVLRRLRHVRRFRRLAPCRDAAGHLLHRGRGLHGDRHRVDRRELRRDDLQHAAGRSRSRRTACSATTSCRPARTLRRCPCRPAVRR